MQLHRASIPNLVMIGNGAPMFIAGFREMTGYTGPIYTDPSLAVYKAAQLKRGATLTDFADNMAMEYRIGSRVVRKHDFLEGVRAVIIDKDNAPRWDPARLEDVTESSLHDIFAPLPPEEEWTPLT